MNKIIEIQKLRRKDTYILFPLSLPLFFVLYHLVKLEIQEHFIYGQVSEGTVEDISFYSSSTRGANIEHIKFHIKIPSKKVLIEADEQEEN